MTNGAGPLDPGAVDQLDELPVLDPSTAHRVTDRVVRPPMSFWDRSKLLILSFGLWWILLWAALSNNPIEPFSTAVGNELKGLLWLEVLFGLELIRQIHYLISERSAGWHRFWSEVVFGGLNRQTHRINDWNRFRIGRAIRVVIFLALLAVILAAFFHTSPLVSLFQVPAAFITALPLIVQLLFYMLLIVVQFGALFWFLSRGGVDTYFPGDVKTRFTDVWGQDAVLERVKESIIYLKDPDEIESRGGYVPGGILLWGPPGTGKTLIAEAVAGETHNPFVFVDPGAFTNMFMGVGILKVKSLFRKLRKLALRYGGVVVFFDEADSLGNRGALGRGGGVFGPSSAAEPKPWQHVGCHGGTYVDPAINAQMVAASGPFAPPDDGPFQRSRMMAGMMGGGGMGTLQSLLSELSGLKKPRGVVSRVVRRTMGFPPKPPPKYRIMVMMATNMPESLDEALLRPGRIDRIYKVGYPSKAGRVRTYQGYFSKVKHELTSENMDRLATVTPYATGATIKDLVNESLINAIRAERETITWQDVVKAKQLKELGPPEDVEYVERERHATAVHEACHAVTAVAMNREMVIDVATIEKGGSYLGMVTQVRVEDTFTRWRTDYEGQVMVFLASLAGEKMFFGGDNSSGLHSDLEQATRIAIFMEGYWGMGRTVASHGITKEAGIGGEGPNDRRKRETGMLAGGLGVRIEAKLEELLERTRQLLEENRLQVLAVAHALEQFKTVTGEDVIAIVRGTEGPLIDGTRYHTDEFRALVEEYHTKMVEAHESRNPKHIEFPLLPGVVREPLEPVSTYADHEAIDPTH
ncbi:MAG TPA: AAA family ATPase [Acidimicrobiales bacterium]|nr:AAA family ATPase [Acidimicrobiales bacterium]